jgi:hypothetical protein
MRWRWDEMEGRSEMKWMRWRWDEMEGRSEMKWMRWRWDEMEGRNEMKDINERIEKVLGYEAEIIEIGEMKYIRSLQLVRFLIRER